MTSQVWASNFLPNEAALSDRCQRAFHREHGEPLLLQYARQEAERKVPHTHTHTHTRLNRTVSPTLPLPSFLVSLHRAVQVGVA